MHPTVSLRWQPILDESERLECERSAVEVADALDQPDCRPERVPYGLAGGNAGLAIFYDYLFRALGRGEDRIRRDARWSHAIDQLGSRQNPTFDFTGGFSGLAWTACMLQSGASGANSAPDAGAVFEEVEQALLDELNALEDPCHYDLIRGYVGTGIFALERWPRPFATQALARIVEHLEHTAEWVPAGVRWVTPPSLLTWRRQMYPSGYYNLGAAHGVPVIWYVLAHAARRNVSRATAMKLLEGSIAWVLDQRIRDSTGLVFPDIVCEQTPTPSQLRWCYGDLGMAAVLLAVAQCLEHSDWERVARDLGRNATRISFEASGVQDTGLCHGTAGVGHVFNRFYQATGEEVFRDAARAWLKKTLLMRLPEDGIAGYAAWISDNQRMDGTFRWTPLPGLLAGAAGTALALLAGCKDIEPSWDRFLCISPTPVQESAAPSPQ